MIIDKIFVIRSLLIMNFRIKLLATWILLYNSFKKIYHYPLKNINEKAYWAASFIFLISQLVDVQYFDGRISIVFWLLLAGLKTIIDEKKLI